MQVYLAKGVLATTAIEGNTLSEEEALEAVQGRLFLPPSRDYLRQEIENVIRAYNEVRGELARDPDLPFTPERLKRGNQLILESLELDEGVAPGELRTHSVVVGRYRAVPAVDCDYLVGRLCDWLNGDDFNPPTEHPELAAPLAVVKAVVAHLYLAWIHPFGDGNGRTARLLELQILLRAGFPPACCQLLSKHYNQTRTEYYRQLDAASRDGSELGFISYATRGFVDQLREQLDVIWRQQFEDRWEQFVYRRFGELRSESDHRKLRLVLAVSRESWLRDAPVPRGELTELTPDVAAAYATKTGKTLTRDLNAVAEMRLLRRRDSGWEPVDEQILGLSQGVGGVLSPGAGLDATSISG